MYIGWVRAHRTILDNEIYIHDPTAWRIFFHLLLIVDRENASWSGGRFQLSEQLSVKPVTLYKALKRLEKSKMVTLASNNRFTTISICKWEEYQSNDNTSHEQQSNNKVTAGEQQSSTLTISKKKELRNKNSEEKELHQTIQYLEAVPQTEVDTFTQRHSLEEATIKSEEEKYHDWVLENGKQRTIRDYRAGLNKWLRNGVDKGWLKPVLVNTGPTPYELWVDEQMAKAEKEDEMRAALKKEGWL